VGYIIEAFALAFGLLLVSVIAKAPFSIGLIFLKNMIGDFDAAVAQPGLFIVGLLTGFILSGGSLGVIGLCLNELIKHITKRYRDTAGLFSLRAKMARVDPLIKTKETPLLTTLHKMLTDYIRKAPPLMLDHPANLLQKLRSDSSLLQSTSSSQATELLSEIFKRPVQPVSEKSNLRK